MDSFIQDLRFAARQLIKHRAFTVVAVLTLALGIGANTAIFSVVYGVLLRALPYRAPEQLVGLAGAVSGSPHQQGITYTEFQFLAERKAGMNHVAAMTSVSMNLTTRGTAQHLDGVRVSQDYFPTLGIAPMLGRNFSVDEDQVHGPSTVMLSFTLWQRSFESDPGVVGRTVQLDGVPTIIIGVMPAGFESLPSADIWSTLAQVSTTVGSGENLEFVGRMQAGVTLAQVNARSAVAFADFRDRFHTESYDPGLHLSWRPFGELMVADVSAPVKILFGAIGFVLLIACANVASLVLGRTAGRNRELAVRVALGATRRRVIRQILTENALLALAGGLVAVAFASWGLHALLNLVPSSLPRTDAVHLDARALLFTIVVAMATGLIFGLVPAWQMARTDPQSTLKEAAARTTGSAAQGRLRNVLVTGEVALALVLLSGAGLMIRTFGNLMRTDAGFDPSHQVSAEIWLTGSRYDSSVAVSAFYRQVMARLSAVPGVQSAAVVEAGLPLERGGNMSALQHGQPVGQNDYRTITPGYFATLGVHILQGRDITSADDDGAAPVMLVNREFAHQYLHDAPLGEQLSIGGNPVQRTVVGVVGDVRSFVGLPAQPTVYLPSAQTPFSFTRVFNGWYPIHVLARTQGNPAYSVNAIRQAIASVDPQVPVGRVQPLRDVLLRSLAMQRFVMMLLSAFAALAIVLAMVGVYGLISWFVVRRTRDIGVRIALGASRGDVLRMIVGRGMALAGAGVVLGLLGSLALTRLLASMLYQVKPADPLVLGEVSVALAVVAGVASYLPARRATRVDPLIAMRAE